MTGAALAIALLALSAAPASAGFRYVPPEIGAVQSEEPGHRAGAEDGTAGATAANTGPDPGPSPQVWQVHAGERLREVLARWAARADVEVLFLTDRGWRLDGAASFEGGFVEAVQGLFRNLSYLPHPPVAARSEGGTTLVVRHRLPASAAGGETQ